jgi:hypothetical protein
MNTSMMTSEIFDDFSGNLGIEKTPTIPATPMDNPLFAFDKTARDSNRLPAKILADDWIRKVSTGNVQIVDDYGQAATFQKSVPVEPDDDSEPIELSPELLTKIQEISGCIASASWRSFSRSLGKVTSQSQPLAKRAISTDPFAGRKVLSVKRDGKLQITKYENGELLEIVDDEQSA